MQLSVQSHRGTSTGRSKILANSKAAFDYYFPNVWNRDSRFKVIYNGINAKSFIEESADAFSKCHFSLVLLPQKHKSECHKNYDYKKNIIL